jgi:hypothetical protein
MHHSFDTSIAAKYGVNVAIFLNNMIFWLNKNIANEKHFYDGKYWTYNSVKAYARLFPYWSEKQVRTIIDHCVKHNLIEKGNYNQNKHDKTLWYTFTEKGCELLNFSICPNGQMVTTKWANGSDQKGKCIKETDINTYVKPDNSVEPVDKPDWLPTKEWEEFKQHRKSIKKPMNPLSEKKLILKLERLKNNGCNIVEILNESIMNGWSGVFEIKKTKQTINDLKINKSYEEMESISTEEWVRRDQLAYAEKIKNDNRRVSI